MQIELAFMEQVSVVQWRYKLLHKKRGSSVLFQLARQQMLAVPLNQNEHMASGWIGKMN